MIRILISLLLIALVFIAHSIAAGSDNLQTITNWGESTYGVQLSIELSSNNITAGSINILHGRIRNSSRNDIAYIPIYQYGTSYIIITNRSGPIYKDGVLCIITNKSGNIYKLLPPAIEPESGGPSGTTDLIVHSGEVREWFMRLEVGRNIEPGNYVFAPIVQDIKTPDGKVCTLTSNSLKVKVVKGD